MLIKDKFLADIAEFLEETGIKTRAFGVDSVGSPGFLYNLRSEHRAVTDRTMDAVYAYMRRVHDERTASAAIEDC